MAACGCGYRIKPTILERTTAIDSIDIVTYFRDCWNSRGLYNVPNMPMSIISKPHVRFIYTGNISNLIFKVVMETCVDKV